MTNDFDPFNRFREIATWFETLTPSSLSQIERIYAADATFCDPFNELKGIGKVMAVYDHMFLNLNEPRFVIHQTISQDRHAVMMWTFNFVWRNRAQKIVGCTHFEIDQSGLITMHRDYWDAAQELYEKIPLLGFLMRWLRRRLAIQQ